MPTSVIRNVEDWDTINAQTDEDLTFEDQSPTPLTNEDTVNPIEGDIDTGVDDEGNADLVVKNYTGIGISIPGLGMRELGIAMPGVEEPGIEKPGV